MRAKEECHVCSDMTNESQGRVSRDGRAHYGITPDCPGWMYTMFCTCETESVRVFVYQHIDTCHLHCLTFLSRVSSTSYTALHALHPTTHTVFFSHTCITFLYLSHKSNGAPHGGRIISRSYPHCPRLSSVYSSRYLLTALTSYCLISAKITPRRDNTLRKTGPLIMLIVRLRHCSDDQAI